MRASLRWAQAPTLRSVQAPTAGEHAGAVALCHSTFIVHSHRTDPNFEFS